MAAIEIVSEEPDSGSNYIQWSSVWAGAFAAAATSFVLLTFGSAIGLAVAPLASSWRAPSVLFTILSGLWVLATALASMGLGAYLTGRSRTTWRFHDREVEVRDGMHGLVTWALALTLGALLSGASAAFVALAPTPAGGLSSSPAAGPVAYQVDRLLRPAQGLSGAAPVVRDQTSRALLAATAGSDFAADDRADLVSMVEQNTGLPRDRAAARVDQSISQLRQQLRTARHAAIILAFITAASAAASAAVAWQAARSGGRHRDGVA